MARLYRPLFAVAVLLLFGPAVPAASAAPAGVPAKIGIADQKADMFIDERFRALGVRYVRISVPWDVRRHDFAAREVDAWLQAARAAQTTPLVAFQRSRVRPRFRPTVAQYAAEVRAFRLKYPWVREYATWNEPNLEDARRPKLIAGYYRALRTSCPSCTVLGGDLVDLPSVDRWVKEFHSHLRGPRPKVWGLHNYVSANRFSAANTDRLRRAIGPSRLWLTETGGLVARRSRSKVKLRQGPAHAAKVTRFILRTWGRDPQVPRIYLYHWDSTSMTDSWDSAFIGPDGRARPALGVLRDHLRAR